MSPNVLFQATGVFSLLVGALLAYAFICTFTLKDQLRRPEDGSQFEYDKFLREARVVYGSLSILCVLYGAWGLAQVR